MHKEIAPYIIHKSHTWREKEFQSFGYFQASGKQLASDMWEVS